MNYYPHHIGDYLRDTAHLSALEDGIYRRMLDLYYSSERPLPLNLDGLYRLVRAKSRDEKRAVDSVLGEFFLKVDTGYANKRAEEEILKWSGKSGKARSSAEQRWERERNAKAMRTHSEGDAGAQCERNANQNHNQNHNQKLKEETTTTAPDASHRAPKLNGHRISFDFEKGAFTGISEPDELRWQEAYPAVPIPPAIVQAAAWLHANPANKKSNYERFLVNWFKRDQDKAGRVRK